ncbi:hypothetical protein [Rheinheimera pleomorphica]|uniref:hypothetical protein n=1 Tax=Rheinheimera pleomorphica TaxID=2703963 RepID=UPI001420E6BE|nr:hypothetical protein [Rheinheimera pleomorphica]
MLRRSLMLLVFAASVQAKPQLTWLQTDWPPHQIVSGPFQGQGTFDLVQQHLMAGMPQFVHQSRLVSLPRLEQAFVQQETAICVLGALYSDERAQNRLFSVPMAVGPALAVGYLSLTLTQHPAMQAEGAELSALVLDSALTGAYQPNRYYPPVVAAALAQPNSNLSRYTFSSEVNAAALLVSGRVNYVVEYPERMQYYNQLLPEPAALEHRAIVGANIASVSYVSCSMDEVGTAAIAAVNQALPALWQQVEYLEAMQRWLDDSARRRLGTDMQRLQQQALMQFKPAPHDTVKTRH